MNKVLPMAAMTLALLLASAADGKNLVREFSGTDSNKTTAEFRVDGPWLLDWRVNGDYASHLAFEISLIDSKTGRHVGRVLRTERRGNGVKLFDEGGTYRLRISSSFARWNIRIDQITPEEAEAYTPRPKFKPD